MTGEVSVCDKLLEIADEQGSERLKEELNWGSDSNSFAWKGISAMT